MVVGGGGGGWWVVGGPPAVFHRVGSAEETLGLQVESSVNCKASSFLKFYFLKEEKLLIIWVNYFHFQPSL